LDRHLPLRLILEILSERPDGGQNDEKAPRFFAARSDASGATVGAYAGFVSPYFVTIEQVGANVVATGIGEINTTGFPGASTTGSSAPQLLDRMFPILHRNGSMGLT
jgi:hypothetical protein